MTLPAGNSAYEGNIAVKPDRILPCTWNALTEVMSEGNITCEGNITSNMTDYYPARDILLTNESSNIAYEY